jgi:signal transduction histidine kinase
VRDTYQPGQGLGKGRVSNLRLDADGALWVATAGGLSHVRNGHAATLTTANGLPCDVVHWAVADEDRSLWLNSECGLIRVARADIDAWVANPEHVVKPLLFDASDGARLDALPTGYDPFVAKSSDGKLWFVGFDGAVEIVDPRHLPFNTIPPPVHIEQIVADHRTVDVRSGDQSRIGLPPRTRDVQIDYTALSLAAPEKVLFRYQLEGVDNAWQTVGTRRQAFYNNLAPGNYRFRVIASNNSGVWNETGDSLEFSIAPAYYQTSWFLALSVLSVIGLAWTAHRVRLRIVERHQREISALNERTMKAQEQERIRIAGELHDGVMQDMLAATMMLGSAKRRIPDNPEASAAIDKVQQKLIQAGTELRQLSHDLHPPLLQEAGLPKAVEGYCDQFSNASGIPIECHADDSVGELSRGASLALFRILQEALGNIAKHAQARRIAVRLTRANGDVTLAVSDDGIGLDRSRLARGGGLGLVMMRERATQLNGTLDVESAPGRGTTIKVTIPFR